MDTVARQQEGQQRKRFDERLGQAERVQRLQIRIVAASRDIERGCVGAHHANQAGQQREQQRDACRAPRGANPTMPVGHAIAAPPASRAPRCRPPRSPASRTTARDRRSARLPATRPARAMAATAAPPSKPPLPPPHIPSQADSTPPAIPPRWHTRPPRSAEATGECHAARRWRRRVASP